MVLVELHIAFHLVKLHCSDLTWISVQLHNKSIVGHLLATFRFQEINVLQQ